MKKIMSATLRATNNEYQWAESLEIENTSDWNGDVEGYLDNCLEIDGEYEVISCQNYEGPGIHNVPEGAFILIVNETPAELYWAE